MHETSLSAFIWSVADLLRGDYRQSEYGKVILPFTVLRRLDMVLEPTKAAVLAEQAKRTKAGLNPEPFLLKAAGLSLYNPADPDGRRVKSLSCGCRARVNAPTALVSLAAAPNNSAGDPVDNCSKDFPSPFNSACTLGL